MAYDALSGQFQKKKEDDAEVRQTRLQSGGVSSSGGVGTTAGAVANPTGGFGGTGGSAENSGGGFVNYGTLYGLNEDKAKQMASGVYRGAEKKAEDAKGALGAAQNQFTDKKNAGAGAWNPIGGVHGTRIETGVAPEAEKTPAKTTPSTSGDWSAFEGPESVKTINTGGGITARGVQDAVAAGEDATSAAGGAARRGTSAGSLASSRYASLYGQPTTGEEQDRLAGSAPGGFLGGLAAAPSTRGDYYHSVRPLDAKSGAGQDYTGPDSLKESMGDEAFAGLQDQFRTAEEDIAGLSEAGGIAEALGYGGVEGNGNASMDAGLTQTAGQSNFARLKERYGGLGKSLATAQSDSIADVGRAEAASDVAAADWERMLGEYEEAKAPGSNVITIGSAGGTAGRRAGSESGRARDGSDSGPAAGTGHGNASPELTGTNKNYPQGLWPSGMSPNPDASWKDAYGTDSENEWKSFYANLPEATKEWLATLTPEERQAWADAEWAKLNGGK